MVFKKNLLKILTAFTASAMLLSGCNLSSSKEEASVPETEITEESTVEAVILEPEGPDLTGLSINPLTGIYIDEDKASLRPIGVMINNNHACLPQSGLQEADIYYEVLAEGGITRLFAVFQSMSGQKIGPIRSAREYFTTFALDNDALFIHHGGSPTGYSSIRERKIENLDGMNGGAAFFRDSKRANTPGMYEHSSYISAEGLYEQISSYGYRSTADTERKSLFSFISEFDDELTLDSGIDAPYVMIPVSYSQISEFIYDKETSLYERYQNSSPHIDGETNETLTVKNIIIQFTDINVISGDAEGRITVGLVGEGAGKYISNGKAVDITWKKDSQTSVTSWYDSEGKELQLNCGKTWIMVIQNGTDVSYGSETQEEAPAETPAEN